MEETEAGLQTPLYLRTSIIRRKFRKILELHYNSAVPDAMEICSIIKNVSLYSSILCMYIVTVSVLQYFVTCKLCTGSTYSLAHM